MAKRVAKKAPKSAAGSNPAAEQVGVLSPDITINVGDCKVTVREYGFFEGLEVAARAAGFIAAMHDTSRDGGLRYDRIRRLFGVHQDVVVSIAAQAADVDPEWVRGLSRDDAEVFMSTWFGVNSRFFVNEVVVEMREERQRDLQSTGSTSLPSSPAPDSAPSTTSADSPSAN